MLKNLVAAAAVAVFWSAGIAQATGNHPDIVEQYELKDGNTLYVFKGGKMGMEDKKGRAVSMRAGKPMETTDGQKIMMYGNEIWAVKAHNRPKPEEDPNAEPVHRHTNK